MPAAPTAFTITETAGSPLVELEWEHTGTALDRFEILKRPVGGSTWERVLLAPKADFGTAPNFSTFVLSRTATQFVVRALETNGTVST